MTRFLGIFFVVCAFSIVIFFLHISFSYLLPFPFSKINAMMLFLVLLILFGETGRIAWSAFLLFFSAELFTSGPFGMLLFSGTIATVIAYWLHRYLFTDESWYAGVFLAVAALVCFRGLYSLLLFAGSFQTSSVALDWGALSGAFGLELIFTGLAAGLLYILIFFFKKYIRL